MIIVIIICLTQTWSMARVPSRNQRTHDSQSVRVLQRSYRVRQELVQGLACLGRDELRSLPLLSPPTATDSSTAARQHGHLITTSKYLMNSIYHMYNVHIIRVVLMAKGFSAYRRRDRWGSKKWLMRNQKFSVSSTISTVNFEKLIIKWKMPIK